MIFQFNLYPIEDISPWGEPPNQSLSWFGFTDGEYRLKVGSEFLLDFSVEYIDFLNKEFSEYHCESTFVDYQVVRLWEDVLEMLPSVLEPVPNELQHFFSSYEKLLDLRNKLSDWEDAEILKGVEESEPIALYEPALFWISDRQLDNGYLVNPARIYIWSDEKDVVFSWDNREVKDENMPVWSATHGNYRISKKDFIDEVKKFDESLISQMNERVEAICKTWDKPQVKVDFEYLKIEQRDRATWLESNLKNVWESDWNKIISAIKIVDV